MAKEAAEIPARTARRLLRAAETAVLGTLIDGAPYASLVLVATDADAAPLLLLSDLAEHTQNLKRDARVSLLVDGTAGYGDPLTGPRVTLQGEIARADDAPLKRRYTARHPSAARYVDFHDFHLYRIAATRAHLVAGFGRIDWIDAAPLRPPASPALVEAEEEILAHMNADHAAALDLYANRLLGRAGQGWRMTGIDAEGLDLRRGAALARLEFPEPIADAASARHMLVRLAQKSRSA